MTIFLALIFAGADYGTHRPSAEIVAVHGLRLAQVHRTVERSVKADYCKRGCKYWSSWQGHHTKVLDGLLCRLECMGRKRR